MLLDIVVGMVEATQFSMFGVGVPMKWSHNLSGEDNRSHILLVLE